MIIIRTPDRLRPTLKQYLSLKWWLADDRMDAGWTRKGWGWRNPMANAFHTIIGVNHLPRLTVGTNGIDTYPVKNVQLGLTMTFRCRGLIPVLLPLMAFKLFGYEICIGWKFTGAFCPLSIRKEHAKNATDVKPS